MPRHLPPTPHRIPKLPSTPRNRYGKPCRSLTPRAVKRSPSLATGTAAPARHRGRFAAAHGLSSSDPLPKPMARFLLGMRPAVGEAAAGRDPSTVRRTALRRRTKRRIVRAGQGWTGRNGTRGGGCQSRPTASEALCWAVRVGTVVKSPHSARSRSDCRVVTAGSVFPNSARCSKA